MKKKYINTDVDVIKEVYENGIEAGISESLCRLATKAGIVFCGIMCGCGRDMKLVFQTGTTEDAIDAQYACRQYIAEQEMPVDTLEEHITCGFCVTPLFMEKVCLGFMLFKEKRPLEFTNKIIQQISLMLYLYLIEARGNSDFDKDPETGLYSRDFLIRSPKELVAILSIKDILEIRQADTIQYKNILFEVIDCIQKLFSKAYRVSIDTFAIVFPTTENPEIVQVSCEDMVTSLGLMNIPASIAYGSNEEDLPEDYFIDVILCKARELKSGVVQKICPVNYETLYKKMIVKFHQVPVQRKKLEGKCTEKKVECNKNYLGKDGGDFDLFKELQI